jgi:phospholipid transport system substrate-binding protein
VVIENVSLVSNYRTQFNDILAKNTPEQMLEILRKKVKGQRDMQVPSEKQ